MPYYEYMDSHVKDKTVSPTVLSLTWESLGKTVFILRRGPEVYGKTRRDRKTRRLSKHNKLQQSANHVNGLGGCSAHGEEIGHHWCSSWLIPNSISSHYQKQLCHMTKWTTHKDIYQNLFPGSVFSLKLRLKIMPVRSSCHFGPGRWRVDSLASGG